MACKRSSVRPRYPPPSSRFAIKIFFSLWRFSFGNSLFTANIDNRLKNHNQGGTKSTAYRRPFQFIFCEFYEFEKDTRNGGYYFKTTAGKNAVTYTRNGVL